MVTRSRRPAGRGPAVGDRVRFTFGVSPATGRIVSTRGPMEHPSQIRYLVEFSRDGTEPLRVELSREELKLVSKTAA